MRQAGRSYSDQQSNVRQGFEELNKRADEMLAVTVYTPSAFAQGEKQVDLDRMKQLAMATWPDPGSQPNDESLMLVAPMVEKALRTFDNQVNGIKSALGELYRTQYVLYTGLYKIYEKTESIDEKLDAEHELNVNTNEGVGKLLEYMQLVNNRLGALESARTTTETMDVETESVREIKAIRDDFSQFTSQFAGMQQSNEAKIAELIAALDQKSAEVNECARILQGERESVGNLSTELATVRVARDKNAELMREREQEVALLMREVESARNELAIASQQSASNDEIARQLREQAERYERDLQSRRNDYTALEKELERALREKNAAEDASRKIMNETRLLQIQCDGISSKAAEVDSLREENASLQLNITMLIQDKSAADSRALTAQEESKQLAERASQNQNAALKKAQEERSAAIRESALAKDQLEAMKRKLQLLELQERAANEKKAADAREKERLEALIVDMERKEQQRERQVAADIELLRQQIRKQETQLVVQKDQTRDADEIERLQREKEVAERQVREKEEEIRREREHLSSEIAAVKKKMREASELGRGQSIELEQELAKVREELAREKIANSEVAKAKQMIQWSLSLDYGEWSLKRLPVHKPYNQSFVEPLGSVERLVREMNAALLKERAAVQPKAPYLPGLGMVTRLASKWSLEEAELVKGLMSASRVDGEFTATVFFYSLPTEAFPKGELRQAFVNPGVNEFALPERRVIVIDMAHPLEHIQLRVNGGSTYRIIPVRGLFEYYVQRKSDKVTVAAQAKQEYAIAGADGLAYMTVVDADAGRASLKCRVIGAGFVRLDAIWIDRNPANAVGIDLTRMLGTRK